MRSMAWAMRDLVDRFDWQPGCRLILNDPYAGGTHLPDVTVVAPVFAAAELVAFVVNRAEEKIRLEREAAALDADTDLDRP